MESKVFWGVLCALLVFSGIMWALFALGVVGVRAEVEVADRQAAAQQKEQLADLARYDAQQATYARRFKELDLASRVLGDEHRCVGGVVLVVRGESYTQLGTVGAPVRCEGRYADRPIR